jgi:hypothetical protein
MSSTCTAKPVVKPTALTLAAVLCIGLGVRAVMADGLDQYTGYTRPGALNDTATPAEGEKPARLEPVKTGLGATVYFRVYDLADGIEGDPWNTGVRNFTSYFVPGKDSTGNHPSRKLDTTARYLYLYQTVNDSKRESNVRTTTVRLIVPPHLITSWGFFDFKGDDVPERGMGFSHLVTDPGRDHPDFKNHIRPVSVDNPGADRATPYERHAPAHIAAKSYGLQPIALGNIRTVALNDNGLEEDVGRAPEAVVLMTSATFDDAPRHRPDVGRIGNPPYMNLDGMAPFCGPFGRFGYPFVSRMDFNPAALYGPTLPPAAVGLYPALAEEELKRSPAIRAYWLDNPLKPGERATIFGFTSNYPPVFEAVRLRGNPRSAIRFIANLPDSAVANLIAEGEVPTPVAFEQVGAVGSTVGFLGCCGPTGTEAVGGGGVGVAGSLPGFGGSLSTGTTGAGGTTGSGTTGTTTPTAGNTTVTLTNTNSQSQQQQQQQKQKQQQQQQQEQSQTAGTAQVIPEPAAFLTALLGLPVVFLVARRRPKGMKGKPTL